MANMTQIPLLNDADGEWLLAVVRPLEIRIDAVHRENLKQAQRVKVLLAALIEITHAHKAIAGSVPVVTGAEQAIQSVLSDT